MSREGAVAVIKEEGIAAKVAQEDVLIAIVVDVASDDAVAVAAESQTRPLGDILKPATARVAVQAIGNGPRRIDRQRVARRETEVHLAVVIEVEDRHARAVGRGELLGLGHSRDMHEVDPGTGPDVGEAERTRRARRFLIDRRIARLRGVFPATCCEALRRRHARCRLASSRLTAVAASGKKAHHRDAGKPDAQGRRIVHNPI